MLMMDVLTLSTVDIKLGVLPVVRGSAVASVASSETTRLCPDFANSCFHTFIDLQ